MDFLDRWCKPGCKRYLRLLYLLYWQWLDVQMRLHGMQEVVGSNPIASIPDECCQKMTTLVLFCLQQHLRSRHQSRHCCLHQL